MVLTAYCTGCKRLGHWADACPDRRPVDSRPIKKEVVKKPWVKPEIRKYHMWKAVSLTETKDEALDRLKPGGVSLTGFDRKAYQREYMRKKRGVDA